jgi:hypothetical protein
VYAQWDAAQHSNTANTHRYQSIVSDIQACQVLQLTEVLQGCEAVAGQHQLLHVPAVCDCLRVLQVCVSDLKALVDLLCAAG